MHLELQGIARTLKMDAWKKI